MAQLWSRSVAGLSPLAPSQVTTAITNNWSGDVLTGGRFTAVTGTFTVPTTTAYAPGSTLSEWVGLDGWDNASLVQAGVNVLPQPHGAALVEPWWEVLPSAQQHLSGVWAHAGDTVTVTLADLGPAVAISFINDTRGEGTTIERPYSGPLDSAEWIVEANGRPGGTITPLAPYAPSISFTHLAVTGPQSLMTQVALQQGGSTLSQPSAFSASQFSVGYTP